MNDKKRATLVKYARKHLGKPYKFGSLLSEAPKTFDCSSFIQYLYQRIGVQLPRTALDQASQGKSIDPKNDQLKIGDLLFFKGGWGHYNPAFPIGIGHVGIYVGKDKVINAKYQKNENDSDGGSVVEETVESFLNRPDFVIVKRILD